MKKFLMIAVLVFATAAVARTFPEVQDAPQQPKTIKDPNEYNAYISATNLADLTQRAAALEAFVQQYPNSVVREESLQGMMIAYQQTGNPTKALDSAKNLIKVSPNNVQGLAVFVNAKRTEALGSPQAAAKAAFAEASQAAIKGLAALPTYKPDGIAAPDLAKQKEIFATVFNGAAGHAALAEGNLADAQKYLRAAADLNPDNAQDVFPLSIAYLTLKPPTDDAQRNGLWFIARTIALVPTFADAVKTGKYYYKRFHGKEEGWDQLLAMAKAQSMTPPDLSAVIKKAPSPAEQVTQMLAENPNVDTMSFGEWVLIFTYGSTADKNSSFDKIKGKPFKFQGTVISATLDSVAAALTEDAIQAKTPEVVIQLAEPLKKAPEAGAKFSFQAKPASFTSDPVQITMDDGLDLTPPPVAPKKPPVRKPPVRKPATRR